MESENDMDNRHERLWKIRLRRFLRNRLSVMGTIFIVLLLVAFILTPILCPYDPTEPNFSAMSKAPSAEHLCGTDTLGRDIFARLIYGGEMSCLIALIGAMFSTVIGVILGCLAGYVGGVLDNLFVRISELFQIFPQMILILLMMSFMGQSTFNVILIFSITGWPGTFRQVRAEVLSLREETYIKVCESFGMSRSAIMFKQMLPSLLTIVIIQITMRMPSLVLSEAGLSYLGVGVPSSQPTWGNMLNAAKSISVITNNWWMWVIPGVLLTLFVLAVNFLGDGLRDVLDPKQQ